MSFRIGEKVKFLNEKGGGMVKRTLPDGTVLVEVDGFDIPFSPSELVKLETETKPAPETEVVTKVEPTKTVSQVQPTPKAKELPNGVYLALIPEDEEQLLACPIEVALYNKTSYHLFYTLSQKEINQFFCSALGEAKPQSYSTLLKVLRNELESLSVLRFQGIKFKKGALEPQEPLDITIKLKPVKFYKENNYKDIPELGCKAILYDLSGREIATEEKPKPTPTLGSHQGMLGRQKAKTFSKIKSFEDLLGKQKSVTKIEDEVDLHIEEILDDHRGMTNGEIVQVQLKHFQRKLDEAIAKHYKKITFIHGVGKGVLKEEILRLLKEYKGIEYRDAPYDKYGYGATEVMIK